MDKPSGASSPARQLPTAGCPLLTRAAPVLKAPPSIPIHATPLTRRRIRVHEHMLNDFSPGARHLHLQVLHLSSRQEALKPAPNPLGSGQLQQMYVNADKPNIHHLKLSSSADKIPIYFVNMQGFAHRHESGQPVMGSLFLRVVDESLQARSQLTTG